MGTCFRGGRIDRSDGMLATSLLLLSAADLRTAGVRPAVLCGALVRGADLRADDQLRSGLHVPVGHRTISRLPMSDRKPAIS